MTEAFIAYPSAHSEIEITISELLEKPIGGIAYQLIPWPFLNIQGLKIDDHIRERINNAEFLIADITYPNFNEYHEVG